jgi:SAM-dependent methyltransferase
MTFQPEAVRAFEHAGWQRAAAPYNGTFAHATAPFVAPLLDAAAVAADKRVLDVACGPGHVAAAAAARGALAQGLDFSAAMVGIARNAYPDIAVTEGDAEDLPYADGAFDAVVSSFGVHHVPRPEAALAECRRVLAPGGRVAFTVWAPPAQNIAWALVFDAIAGHGDRAATDAPPPGGSLSEPEDCLRLLEAAGLVDRSAEIIRADWPLPDAQALVAALSAGTVRMAALIAAQEPSALPAIVAEIERQAERFRRGDHLAIPVAAILARGRRAA